MRGQICLIRPQHQPFNLYAKRAQESLVAPGRVGPIVVMQEYWCPYKWQWYVIYPGIQDIVTVIVVGGCGHLSHLTGPTWLFPIIPAYKLTPSPRCCHCKLFRCTSPKQKQPFVLYRAPPSTMTTQISSHVVFWYMEISRSDKNDFACLFSFPK